MPVFTYKAFDLRDECITGSVIADTAASARQGLRDQGLRLLEVRATAPARTTRSRVARRRRHEASEFARQLALLLRAGISVVDSLDVLARQQTGGLLHVLQQVRDRIASGVSLSEAMEAHSEWFDPVFRNAVRVGQSSGRLDQALLTVADYLKEREAMHSRIVNALAYPCVLLVMGFGVTLFLMTYVIPQLVTVLEETGRPLPTPTVVLKTLSDVITGHWLSLGVAGTLSIASASCLYRWRPVRRRIHLWELQLPLFGPVLRKALMAEFSQTMAMLLQNGVPFLGALRLARDHCRNEILGAELAQMHVAVTRGSDIAPTLAQSRVFPPLVVHILNVGQKSGELTEMLSRLEESYAAEVRLAVGRFASILEPSLIVLMSVLVGFVVLATILPILETTRGIH